MLWQRFQLRRMSEQKLRERLIRRSASAMGYQVTRFRGRHDLIDVGTYALIDTASGTLELIKRDTGLGASLDDVEAFVGQISAARARYKEAFAKED